MTTDQLANRCSATLRNMLENYNDSRVVNIFVASGRRYIGFKIGDQEFTIEIKVEEAK